MYPQMKTFISLLTLIAIVAAYFFSASLYVQGELVIAYSLVLSSVVAFSFWIKSHDFLKIKA
jgi:hypothetical protein